MASVAIKRKKSVKVKSECCKDGPRCKRCPVVWDRLEKAGLAERTGKREFVVVQHISTKQLKAARKRRK